MFVWNMVGALVLIPALSHLLLRGLGGDGQVRPADETIKQDQLDDATPEFRAARAA